MTQDTKYILGALGVVTVLYLMHKKSASKKVSAEARSIIEQDCLNSAKEQSQNGNTISEEGLAAYVKDCTEALIKEEEGA